MSGPFVFGEDQLGRGEIYLPVSYTHLDVYKRQGQVGLHGSGKKRKMVCGYQEAVYVKEDTCLLYTSTS